MLPALAYGFAFAAGMLPVAVLAPGLVRRRLHSIARAWGSGILALYGVRLAIHGRERLDAPGARIVLYNHQSTLDLFLLAALLPARALVVYKSDFHRIPLIGWAIAAVGMVPIDLADRRRALKDLALAGIRARERGCVLLIAPEGARSSSGELQPFKRGAFHLAAKVGLPIAPMVLHGAHDLLPRGSILVRSGTVAVECLPPIDTAAWTGRSLRQRADETRGIFARHLEAYARGGGEPVRTGAGYPVRHDHDTGTGAGEDDRGRWLHAGRGARAAVRRDGRGRAGR